MRSLLAAVARALALSTLATAAWSAAAQTYPTKPIRVVVPSSPGGALDITTRLVAEKVAVRLGQQVIVENRPGGETLTGTRAVKDLPADGYTLLAQANGFTAVPALKLNPGFDPLKDFTGIGLMLRAAQVLWVGVNEPDRSAVDYVARARANPGKMTFAHGGTASPLFLSAALFMQSAALDVAAVPYKGAGNAYPDVAGGRVSSIFSGYTGGAALMQAGKLRPLAVTGEQRMVNLPNVPTFKEQGIPYTYYFWLGLLAPAGTPKDIVDKLAEAMRWATSSKELSERFRAEGSEAPQMLPEEYNAYMAREVVEVAKVVRAMKIEKE